jgi:hypothetical protein
MRKIFTLIFLACSLNTMHAQTLSYTNLTASVSGVISDSSLQALVDIINTGSNTLDVYLTRYDLNVVPGTENSFCWGILCYGSTTFTSPLPATIDGGNTETSFRGDYLPHGYVGTSTVGYTFFDGNNASDSIHLQINYTILPTGINEVKNTSFISAPSPNPANNLTAFSYALRTNSAASVSIINMLGKTIKTFPLTARNGNIILNTVDLPSGIYMIAMQEAGKNISVQKLIVNHR